MRLLKIVLYFLCIMLVMALLASILTTTSNFIFGRVELSNNETIFERLGVDTLSYWLILPYTGFFFPIILLLLLLQLKFRVKVIHVILVGLAAGLIYSYLTKYLIWFSIVRYTNELSYIVVISICTMLFPLINKKLWELFKKEARFFQNILYFLILLLVMVSVASILLTAGDYILCAMYGEGEGCGDKNALQRLAIYFFFYLVLCFSSFFFLILILLSVLQTRFRLKIVYILLIGVPLGFYFSYLTKHLIWSLYGHNPEKQIRYMIVVTICMILFPFIHKKLWALFNKKKGKEIR